MSDSLKLLRVMNGIHEEDVIMAGEIYFNKQKTRHIQMKRVVSFALAAALVLGLAAAAYATGFSASSTARWETPLSNMRE